MQFNIALPALDHLTYLISNLTCWGVCVQFVSVWCINAVKSCTYPFEKIIYTKIDHKYKIVARVYLFYFGRILLFCLR